MPWLGLHGQLAHTEGQKQGIGTFAQQDIVTSDDEMNHGSRNGQGNLFTSCEVAVEKNIIFFVPMWKSGNKGCVVQGARCVMLRSNSIITP